MKLKLLFILAMSTVFLATAQEDATPIATDRPGASDSSTLIGKGVLQLETGGQFVKSENASSRIEDYSYNFSLFRYGLLDHMELRLATDFRSIETTDKFSNIQNTTSGLAPLIVGTKIGIAKEEGWMPQLSFVGNLSLPFAASTDLKPETTAVDFRFLMDHALSDRSSFGYNIGAAIGPENAELAYIYVITYSYSLTSSVTAFSNIYGTFPENSSANHLWDAGFTYLYNNDLQFDITVGSGINTSQDILLNAGLSYRFGRL
jgi:hypothetical protein